MASLGTGATIGVDVGGTFTDVVLHADGTTRRAKAPTNPVDFGDGVLSGLRLLAEQTGEPLTDLLGRVEHLGLGTTAVTNVVTALVGSRVGLVTTRGFEEELNLARGIRGSRSDGRVVGPPQIVPRRCIVGIEERVDYAGTVVRPLRAGDAAAAATFLLEERSVEVVVVSFVNSYRNSDHEDQAVAEIRAVLPHVPVLSANHLSPTLGFLQRTMYVALNAFALSSLDGIEKFVDDIRGKGFTAPLRLVNASGGTTGVRAARRSPMVLMHSGPAAGVAAAAWVAQSAQDTKTIACDMGGTSFDVSIINDGKPLRRINSDVLGVPTSLSVVDVESIGSGGGSIGWIDARGMLRVGPESARSLPGPACYGRGGSKPTVTDALVALGYIDGDRFLGGSMRLDRDAAVRACAEVGARVGLDAGRLAWGIRSLALADMVGAVRLLFNRRGLDVRQYSIVSYGGCGSLFTADIARALGVRRVIVPEVASVLSAFGAASASVRHERSRSIAAAMPVDPGLFVRVLKELDASVVQVMAEEQVAPEDREVLFEADLRFKRQKFQLSIAVPEGLGPEETIAKLTADFQEEYRSRYGEGSLLLGAALELVTLRAVGQGKLRQIVADDLHVAQAGDVQPVDVTRRSTRRVHLDETGEPREVDVYEGADLGPGARVRGPACIDKVDTTIWLPPGTTAEVDVNGSLVIDTSAPAATGGHQ